MVFIRAVALKIIRMGQPRRSLCLILILILIGSQLLHRLTTKEQICKQEWSWHKHSTKDFSLSYPSNLLELRAANPGSGGPESTIDFVPKDREACPLMIAFFRFNTYSSQLPLDDYVKLNFGLSLPQTNIQNTSIDGQRAIIANGVERDLRFDTAFISRKDKIYILTLHRASKLSPEDEAKLTDLFHHIFRTIEFQHHYP